MKLLCETPAFFQDRFFDMWGPFVLTLMKLLELPEDTTVDSQDYVGFDTTPVGYKVEFTVLAHAKQKLEDPVKDIPSPKTYFAQKLNALLQQSGLRQKVSWYNASSAYSYSWFLPLNRVYHKRHFKNLHPIL